MLSTQVEAAYDELRVVESVVKSRTAPVWELATRILGNDDSPLVPYAVGPLVELGMVAAAPAEAQTRAVVLVPPSS